MTDKNTETTEVKPALTPRPPKLDSIRTLPYRGVRK